MDRPLTAEDLAIGGMALVALVFIARWLLSALAAKGKNFNL